MSHNWFWDIERMHDKFGFFEHVHGMNNDILREYLKFRIKFIEEEVQELNDAFNDNDAEEIIDALIDICVVAIGTLETFEVDGLKAWDEVHRCNMAKEAGENQSRPNQFGLPDLVKPDGWTPPSHKGNHGLLEHIYGWDR